MFAKRKLEVRVVKDETSDEEVTAQIISIPKEDVVYVVRETTEIVVLGTVCIIGAVFVKSALTQIVTNILK